MKMYFPGGGKATYYTLNGKDTKLRGIFYLKSHAPESKKLKAGSWSSIAAIEVGVNGKKKSKIELK